jgi:predicted fused transcriptional regulator/phosphomethylpyrimidine kinase
MDDDPQSVLKKLVYAVSLLSEGMTPALIPEVGSNIVYALPDAREAHDVAAVEGRIVRLGDSAHPVGAVAFGASDHMARVVLTAMRFDSRIRSAANIRYAEDHIEILDDFMLEICSFDRTKEPTGARTMDWGVAFCCKNGVPDVIYDRGAVGKEPMIRLLGEDPVTISHNIIKLSGRIKNTK